MEVVSIVDDIEYLNDNQVIGNLKLDNASIEFKGKGNVLYCTELISLKNCKLRFTGNNSLIYFDENKEPFSINIRVGNDSVFYIGKQCFFNKTSYFYATERKNVIIGNECLMSFGVYLRTSDPHLIYDVETKKRLNFSKSILIGDHVWVGQNCLILKNTQIGSGSIIGGNSVVSGKKISSNTLWAGNPAKKIKDNVFYGEYKSTHDYDLELEENSNYCKKVYKYESDKNTINFETFDNNLRSISNVNDKINYIKDNLVNNENKNRFFLK